MTEETAMTETPKIPERLWVRFAGDHMRKWSTEPFDEADACYPRIDLARPAPAEGAVRVKPLEWDERNRAQGYRVQPTYGQDRKPYILTRDGNIIWAYDTVEDAKAEAQADWERRILSALASPEDATPAASFQVRVQPWMMECFGSEISADTQERNHRFLEEALELVQANGCTQSEAHQLVDYVYGRDEGEINQEVGGVMVTLAALCLAIGEDMHEAGETELARIWTKVEKIRAKQASKPNHSPLPQHVATPAAPVSVEEAARIVENAAECGYEENAGVNDPDWEDLPVPARRSKVSKLVYSHLAQQDRRAALREMQSIREEMEGESGE